MSQEESHYAHRVGWLRAAVLGANDGILSTASLITGVAASGTSQESILLAGIASLVAGAMSMAAGEYVSVSSQSDIEKADIAQEKAALSEAPKEELEELTLIYINRGLKPDLAREVATQMTEHDALKTHLRDELGYEEHREANPIQAAIVSGFTFTLGALPPILLVFVTPIRHIPSVTMISSIVLLATLGAIAARAGGAKILKPVLRIVLWGVGAMLFTGIVGKLVGVSIH